jgi:uncharacterized protein DUF6268
MKAFFLTLYLLFGVAITAFSQSFNVGFLFNPGVTVGQEYQMPSALNDSTDFQLSKYNVQFSQPLKTKIGIKGLTLKDFSFKKLDAKASQLFLNYSFGVIQPSVNNDNSFETLYKGGVGLTAITASIKNGIWIYSANIYATENSSTLRKSFTPNFRGYIANIKTKNLKTFYFFGGGLIVNQGKIIPFPLLGIKAKLATKIRTEIIIPVHVKLNYRFSSQLNLDIATHFNGLNSVHREGSAFKNNDQTLNFRQLKTYLALNSKLGKHYKIKLEGGYSSFQQIYSWQTKATQKLSAAPYFIVSVNYQFGKSVFGNFMNQAE